MSSNHPSRLISGDSGHDLHLQTDDLIRALESPEFLEDFVSEAMEQQQQQQVGFFFQRIELIEGSAIVTTCALIITTIIFNNI